MKEVKKGTVRSKIKKGDTVVFIAGKEYARFDNNGKRKPFSGEVMAVDARRGKVKVAGAAIAKKHRKEVPQMNIKGGIIEIESWVDVSNVALLDPKTKKPTRVRFETRDGKKVRVAKSGELISEPSRSANTRRKKSDEEATDSDNK
jgi:large subunit ribosomal protein L24